MIVKPAMLHLVAYFIGIILLLIGIWLITVAYNTIDPSSASQKKTWAVVVLVIGFFLILVAASCHDQLSTVWKC